MKRIDVLNTLTRNAYAAVVLVASVVALSGLANAQSTPSHKSKHGSLVITTPTEVGDTVLQPGDYEVRELQTADGPVVEFVHKFRNELASELVQADEEQVVARVKFTSQTLRAPARQTQLQLASKTAATGLEIRGNAVEYLFTSAPLAAQR